MDLKRLLNLKSIDLDQVNHVISNRKLLLDGVNEFITPELLKRLTSIEVNTIEYYTGDVESIKKLIPFSNKNNIPLFPSDVIEVEEGHRTKQFKSHLFFTHILDGLAANDGFVTEQSGDATRIYNIKSIKIISQNEQEISDLVANIELINADKESGSIEEQFVYMVNDVNSSFSQKKMYKDLNHLMTNFYIKDLSEEGHKRLESNVKKYQTTGNVFFLIDSIKIVSNRL